MATPHKRDRKKHRRAPVHSKKSAASVPLKQDAAASSSQKKYSETPAGESADVVRPVSTNNRPIEHSITPRSTPISLSATHDQDAVPATGELTIFTIGHSTHPIEEFIALLKNYGIEQLVDVRTVPKSRHVPQFNSDALAKSLAEQGITYVHLKALGGLRHPKKDSFNTGWRNASFRGYADYMATDEFAQGIDRLIELAKAQRTVIMCAEAVPWRCHRSLVGDALLVRAIVVEDIMNATSIRPHKLTEFAKVDGQQITYPPEKTLELFPSSAN